jgi:3-hydroxyisobutyrate dehydrogenase-like beta-hydroxyacid dehydrogenase
MNVSTEKEMQSVGFVGLGMLGLPMAARLLDADHRLSVYNRTKSKADGFLSRGARWCENPAAAASQSEVIFSMVSTSEVLTEISLGRNGILHGLRCGTVHVDMSTVSPAAVRNLAERYQAGGCSFLQSPVLGSVPQAADGSLLLFAGGEAAGYRRAEPLLKILGNHI